MTDTTSPGTPGAPDVFSAGAKQIIDMFKRKGLFWEFVLGTAATAAPNGVFYDSLTVPITVDSDTTTVSARSLIGPITEGARVAVIHVPSTGYYIVGYVGNPGHGFRQVETGTTLVSFTTLSSTTISVSFVHSFGAIPNVMININSGAGVTGQWHGRAINITKTGFTLFLFGPSANTWASVPVQWTANEQTV